MNNRERQLAAIYTTKDQWETAGYVPKSTLASALEANNLQAAKIKDLELEIYKQSEKTHIAETARVHYQELYAKERDEHASTKLAFSTSVDTTLQLERENNILRKEARELNTEIRKLRDDLAANDRGASQDSKQLRDLTEMHENCLNDNSCLYQANINMQNKLSILEKEKAQFCNSDALSRTNMTLIRDNNDLTTENIQLKEKIKAVMEAITLVPEYIRVRKPKRFGVF